MARAKFLCETVTDFGNNYREVKLRAVGPDKFDNNGASDDSQFALYTPSGEMKLHINNPNLVDFFKPTKKYYLDITQEQE